MDSLEKSKNYLYLHRKPGGMYRLCGTSVGWSGRLLKYISVE